MNLEYNPEREGYEEANSAIYCRKQPQEEGPDPPTLLTESPATRCTAETAPTISATHCLESCLTPADLTGKTTQRRLYSKDLRKVIRQDGVEVFVRNDDALVFGVQRHSTHLPQPAIRPSDGPSRRNVSVVLDAPYPHKTFIGGPFQDPDWSPESVPGADRLRSALCS